MHRCELLVLIFKLLKILKQRTPPTPLAVSLNHGSIPDFGHVLW